VSPDPAAPAELSFGAAYDRLQAVAAELGADATMAPDRLIALLREGKGLERALRDHLEQVEQEVRAIEDGDGAVAYRIVGGASSVDAARPGGAETVPAPPAPSSTAVPSQAPAVPAAQPTPPAARPTPPAAQPTPPAAQPTPPAAQPTPQAPAARDADPMAPGGPSTPPGPEDRPAAPPAAPPQQPAAPPTLGFPGADDDIPF